MAIYRAKNHQDIQAVGGADAFGNISNKVTGIMGIGADSIVDVEPLLHRKTPSSSTAPGLNGDLVFDDDYLYICISDNNWKRVAIATW